METSDDPIVSLFGGDDDLDLPAVQAENIAKTAEPVEQLTEAQKRARRRAAAGFAGRFTPPKLSNVGLLGVGSQN